MVLISILQSSTKASLCQMPILASDDYSTVLIQVNSWVTKEILGENYSPSHRISQRLPTHQSRYFLWSAFFSTSCQSYEWFLTTEPQLRFIMKFAKGCCQVLLPMASVSYHISDRGKMRPICKVLIIFPYMLAQGQICIAVDTYCHSTVFSAILGGYF